ncbi:MAG: SIS domain-containing protein [Erysipelotrichaceae bacterium]|nr:SIS domain-containing protein [Erysipelotrichaceae bacterium]
MEKPTVLGYMRDQPRALRDCFNRREEFLKPFRQFYSADIKKIYFFGSGTSYNASLIGAYYFRHLVGINAFGEYPTVFKNYGEVDYVDAVDPKEVLFLAISQSGTSISTIDVIKDAKDKGYRRIVLTEALQSEITKHTDGVLHLLCGKELTPPETRGYTVTLLTLYLLALEAAKIRGKLSKSYYDKKILECGDLLSKFESVIAESEAWYQRNKTFLVSSERIYVLGYGIDYGSALEGQLKIGEMLRIPALAYEIEEYSHGPTMAINGKQSLIMIASKEAEFERCLTFRDAFLQYTPRVFLISCEDVGDDLRNVIFSLKADKYLAPLLYTVPMQFVAAQGALDTGIDTGINPFTVPLAHLDE